MPSLIKAVANSNAHVVKQCLAAGESPDAFDAQTGETVLAIAAFNGELEIVRMLLDAGADPNQLQTTEWPLSNAASQGNAEIVSLLLGAHADVDAHDEDGGTALSDAAAGGHRQIVEMLLEAGADPSRKDRNGERPIIYAAHNGHEGIVKMLEPLSTAKDRQRAGLILKLKKQGPPSEAVLTFFSAAKRGDTEAVKAYLDAGGDVDALSETGTTAAFRAAHRGKIEILKILVEHGADVNHLDTSGSCPLYFCAFLWQIEAMKYLYPLTDPKLRARFDKHVKPQLIERGDWWE